MLLMCYSYEKLVLVSFSAMMMRKKTIADIPITLTPIFKRQKAPCTNVRQHFAT